MTLELPRVPDDYRAKGSSFPPDVWREGHNIRFTDKTLEGRTEVHGVTIDAPGTRNFDDAVLVTKQGDDYVVDVSIADADSIIKPGSLVDMEALRRVHAFHDGRQMIPMLPTPLTINQLSLAEGQTRPTITVTIALTPHPTKPDTLQVKDTKIHKTYIASAKQYSFDDINGDLAHPHESQQFRDYKDVADALMKARLEAGAVMRVDAQHGRQIDENGVVRNWPGNADAQMIIFELMTLANSEIAKFLQEQSGLAIYRNQTSIAGKLRTAWFDTVNFGHEGIGHPTFVQATTPLRRYVSIINQRIVAALIGEQQPPHTKEDLQQVTEYLNRRLEAMSRKTGPVGPNPKMVFISPVGRENDPETFRNMAPHEFSESLRSACEKGEISESFKEILLEKMKKNGARKLMARDYVNIFFVRTTMEHGWDEIVNAALALLKKSAHISDLNATGIVNMAIGKMPSEWDSVVYDTVNRKVFLSKKGTTYVAPGTVVHTNKHAAYCEFIEAYVHGTLVETETGMMATPLQQEQPAYALLNNYLQDTYPGKFSLRYEETQSGSATTPDFHCTAVAVIDGHEYRESVTVGGKKKDARATAAEKLLIRLRQGN